MKEVTDTHVDILKKNGKYLTVSWESGQLLDFCQYLPPGCSLDEFMRMYSIPNGKLCWPHGLFTGGKLLKCKTFPAMKDFFNQLKGKITISKEQYEASRQAYIDNGCKNMGQFLKLYCCHDVSPFLDAIQKHIELFYEHFKVNILSEGMTLPAISHRLMMRNTQPKLPFFLPTLPKKSMTVEESKQVVSVALYNEIRECAMGGLALILERIQLRHMTPVRKHSPFLTSSIVGVDFNSLYPYAMQQSQYVGAPMYWRRVDGDDEYTRVDLTPNNLSLYEEELILYLANTEPWSSQLMYSSMHFQGQMTPLQDRRFQVDVALVDSRTCFEMDGCTNHVHGSLKCPYYNLWKNQRSNMEEKVQQANEREKWISNAGWNIVHIPSCHWKKWRVGKSTDDMGIFEGHEKKIHNFLSTYNSLRYRGPSGRKRMSEDRMIQKISDGTLTGLVKCNLSAINNTVRNKYAEFPPIYLRHKVTRDMLGDYSTKLCESQNLLKTGREQLITVTDSPKPQLFDCRYVKWILETGDYKVSDVEYLLQYNSISIFRKIIENLVSLRRYGDSAVHLKPICNMAKILLNSAYGKMIENTASHTYCAIVDEAEALKRIGQRWYISCTALEPCENVYEVSNRKRVIRYDRPIISGFCTLVLSKLHMLKFIEWFRSFFRGDQKYRYNILLTDTVKRHFLSRKILLEILGFALYLLGVQRFDSHNS